MKTSPRYHILTAIVVLLFSLLFVGCASIPSLTGTGIERTWKTPVFTDSITAQRVEKVTTEDGTVIRRATGYRHDTTVAGWGRTVTAEEAEFAVKKEDGGGN